MIENQIICDCNDICKSSILAEIFEKKLVTVEQVGKELNAGTGCGGCQVDIQDILNEINN
ncbi:MAG: (2Fe-2S)-binding protein [Paludibacter sp.]|nr:(2Fe-2S)-binding protein [Paludibacter sp.]